MHGCKSIKSSWIQKPIYFSLLISKTIFKVLKPSPRCFLPVAKNILFKDHREQSISPPFFLLASNVLQGN